MRTLAEVLALQDTDQKICYLKKARKTDLSDAVKLHNDWNPNKHEIITDEEKYPKIKVTVGTEPVLDCKPEQSEEAQIKLTNATFSAKFFVLVLYLVPLSTNQNAMGSKEKLIERFKKKPRISLLKKPFLCWATSVMSSTTKVLLPVPVSVSRMKKRGNT